MARSPATPIADAANAVRDIERQSDDMSEYLTAMAAAVTRAGALYQELGFGAVAGVPLTPAEVRLARDAGRDADRAVRQFQQSFSAWLGTLDRGFCVGRSRRATSSRPASPLN